MCGIVYKSYGANGKECNIVLDTAERESS